MSDTKQQHYVPQFYLKRFAHENDQIYVFDKTTQRSFRTHVKNIAGEQRFYDLPVVDLDENEVPEDLRPFLDPQIAEKELSKLESVAANTMNEFLSHIRKMRKINPKHKPDMARLLAIQLQRTRESREVWRQQIELTGRFLIEFNARFNGVASDNLIVKANEDYVSMMHTIALFNPKTVDTIIGVLLNHMWFVWENRTPQPFFTSDHPVVRRSHKFDPYYSNSGLASPGIEINFPLTPTYILVLADREFFRAHRKLENRVNPCSMDNVTYHNSLQVFQSYRQVYSHTDKFGLAEKICCQHPEDALQDRKRIVANWGGQEI